MKNNNSTVQKVVAAGIGTALYIVLTEAQIPVFFAQETYFHIRAALLAFFAAVYGPIVGLVVGFIGHSLADAFFYSGSVSWSWVIPDALFGVVVGMFYRKYKIQESGFDKKQVLFFNLIQLLGNAVAWIICAPILDILISGEATETAFKQGIAAFICNSVVICILGTFLCTAYSKIVNSSIKKEEPDSDKSNEDII